MKILRQNYTFTSAKRTMQTISKKKILIWLGRNSYSSPDAHTARVADAGRKQSASPSLLSETPNHLQSKTKTTKITHLPKKRPS